MTKFAKHSGFDIDCIFQIDHPTFIVNDLYYKSLPHQCRGKMFKVAAALGINRTEAEKELNKTLEFEEELTMVCLKKNVCSALVHFF